MGSFLAKQPDMLSKLLHSCSDHLSPCWTKDRLEFSCRRHRGLWPRPHACTEYTVIPAEKLNQCKEIYSNSCLSDWLSLRQRCTFNKRVFLHLSVQWHKRTTQVCVREVITTFQRFFPKAFTYKSRVSNTHGAAKSNKHTKKWKAASHREHGKVSDHFQKLGEEFNSMDKIKTLTNDGLITKPRNKPKQHKERNQTISSASKQTSSFAQKHDMITLRLICDQKLLQCFRINFNSDVT